MAMKITIRAMDCFVMCMHTTGERLMFARFPRGIPVPGVGGAGPGTFFLNNTPFLVCIFYEALPNLLDAEVEEI